MGFKRSVVATAAAVGVLATAAVTVGLAQADPADPAAIDWQPCEEQPEADCGTLTVPIDWSKPDGATIDLALARVAATDPENKVGSLLVNPGGPGGSGVGFALSASKSITEQMRANFDIIGMDPRGVAGSNPVQCDQDLAETAVAAQYPADQAQFDTMVAANTAYGESCAEQTGALFPQLDNLDVVDDMEAVRQALGEERLSFYGSSYGTLMGQQYAERYPDKVRAMVLESNMDHSLDMRGFQRTATIAQEEIFGQFAQWCDGESDCALNETGATESWDRLYAKAADGELTDPQDPDKTIRPEELGETLLASSYRTLDWWAFADYLAALDAGDAQAAQAAHSALPEPQLAKGPFEDAYRSMLCQDWDYTLSGYDELDQWHAELEALAPHTKFNTFTFSDVTGCQGWPVPAGNPTAEPEYGEVPPILFINARYDSITPYEWGVAAAERTPGAQLLTYDGSGHGALGISQCVAEYADDYLLTGTLPPGDTHCEAEPVPQP